MNKNKIIKEGLLVAKKSIENAMRKDPVFYMTREERVKNGYSTDNFLQDGYPYTRKGIDYSAMQMGFIKGDRIGEYIDTRRDGKETVLVFNGCGFSNLKRVGNRFQQYMNI